MEKVHGGDIYSYDTEMIDFSANINPLGMAENIKKHIIETLDYAEKYPDTEYKKLGTAIAEVENVDCQNIICGNGAAELIFNIVSAVTPQKAVLISPTFAEYEKALDTVNCKKIFYELKEENNFEVCSDFLDFIKEDTDMVFICQPNNPIGNILTYDFMINIIEKCRKNNVIAVIDECFLDFTGNGKEYSMVKHIDEYKNIFILKAFTKMFAVPGLRIGYGICGNISLLENIYSVRQPWNISSVAEEAALAACGIYDETVEKTVKFVNSEREYLLNELERLGIKYFQPKANYIFFKADEGLKEKLAEKRILIRCCGNYRSLDGRYYRVAVKKHEENMKLIFALEEYVWQRQ